jgi:hypothetical protein
MTTMGVEHFCSHVKAKLAAGTPQSTAQWSSASPTSPRVTPFLAERVFAV